MINKKNWIKITLVLVLSIVFSCIIVNTNLINITAVVEETTEFQYNLISMSSIIGGFLFTGISILISTIDKERIKRLWDNHYLDNLYRSAFVGMISNVLTIFVSFLYLVCHLSTELKLVIIRIEIILVFVGLVFFVWCIKFLVSIISKLRE